MYLHARLRFCPSLCIFDWNFACDRICELMCSSCSICWVKRPALSRWFKSEPVTSNPSYYLSILTSSVFHVPWSVAKAISIENVAHLDSTWTRNSELKHDDMEYDCLTQDWPRRWNFSFDDWELLYPTAYELCSGRSWKWRANSIIIMSKCYHRRRLRKNVLGESEEGRPAGRQS